MRNIIHHGLVNLWNKYISNSVGSWDRLYLSGYDRKMNSQVQRVRSVVLSKIIGDIAQPDARVLDVGCGVGTLYTYIQGQNLKISYHGIDCSSVAILQARSTFHDSLSQTSMEKSPGPTFEVAGFEEFVTSYRYDVIVFNEVLYYFGKRQLATLLEKAGSLLKGTQSWLIVSMSRGPKSQLLWQHPLLARPCWEVELSCAASQWTVCGYKSRLAEAGFKRLTR